MISVVYFAGLLITGICVGNLAQSDPVHGFLVIGLGTMGWALTIGMLEYLNSNQQNSQD